MGAVATTESLGPSVAHGAKKAALWRRLWPAALGVSVAAATAYELSDPRDVAPVVAASGLVYLAAAASGTRPAAWIAFAGSFVLITLDKFAGIDALPWLFALAAVLFAAGLLRRRTRPWWSFPLQSAAMLVLGVSAYIALQLAPTAGGLVVAFALLCHAAWDVHHHRTGRVVDHALAEFCAVLDVLVAILVGILALRA